MLNIGYMVAKLADVERLMFNIMSSCHIVDTNDYDSDFEKQYHISEIKDWMEEAKETIFRSFYSGINTIAQKLDYDDQLTDWEASIIDRYNAVVKQMYQVLEKPYVDLNWD